MAKFRQRDTFDLRHENLKEHFPWIDSMVTISNFMPGVFETWSIKFRKDIVTIPGAREELEGFIKVFFYKKIRRKCMFCWRHTGVIIIVV